MSNPSVCFLASANIGGINFRVEDNLGESIHIHIGKMRIALSINEFYLFTDGIMETVRQLFEVRHLGLEILDSESLKGDWLKDYNKIQSIKTEYTVLESLFMKESYVRNRAIKRIIPIKESGYKKLLEGDQSDIVYYEMPGKLEPSRKQKLDFIKEKIESVGYPWDGNLILVDQDGYIYDGIKRASCLYYLFGGNQEIPVLRIYIAKEKSLEEQRKKAEEEVWIWNDSHPEVPVSGHVVKYTANADDSLQKIKKITLREFVCRLQKINIPFFLVNREKRNVQKEAIATGVIIVEEGKLDTVREKLGIPYQDISPYDDFEFIYTASKPLYYLTEDGPLLVFDRLCCKNKFEKCILPVEKYVLEMSWNSRRWSADWQCYQIGTEIYILIILMDALLEQGYFEECDIDFIERNSEVLDKSEFKDVVEKEFYQYTPLLIENLRLRKYDLVISMYERYSDY